MKTVTAAVDIPIIADESVSGIKDALRLIEARGADVFSVRVSKAGIEVSEKAINQYRESP